MNTRNTQLSFAGGEISPELFGRPDTVQYRNGAALLQNWQATPQGTARSRRGFRYVNDTKSQANPVRLLPFIYSNGQSLVMELGHDGSTGYIRLHTAGGTLRYANPITLGNAAYAVDLDDSMFISNEPHRLPADTQIRLMPAEAAGDLPDPLVTGTAYWANGGPATFATKRFEVHSSSGGASKITFNDIGAGYFRAFLESEWPADWASSTSYTVGDVRYFDATGSPRGVYWCTTTHTSTGSFAADVASGYWYQQSNDGVLTIKTPYALADISKIRIRQNGDVLTFTNSSNNYPIYELRRTLHGSDLAWEFESVSTSPPLSAPTISLVSANRGMKLTVDTVIVGGSGGNTQSCRVSFSQDHNLAIGDVIYMTNFDPNPGVVGLYSDRLATYIDWDAGFYVVDIVVNETDVAIRDLDGRRLVNALNGSTPVLTVSNQDDPQLVDVYYTVASALTSQSYKVTALDADGRESLASAAVAVNNVLTNSDASNDITWGSVTGAVRYNVYKLENGVYGYIGQADTTTFTDDNIAPDLGKTPPLDDASIAGSNYPAAVAGFEQRLFLASTAAEPQTIWASKPGAELDFTYTLPTLPDNRLKFVLDSSQAQTIRHMIGLRDLIVLTISGEFRVRAADDGALTPESVFARQEGYEGASEVPPVAINDYVIYEAARGGHLRKLAFEIRRSGLQSMDVSLRAAHLFDSYSIVDMAAARAPFPIIWACSSSGKLLGLTFVPEEQVEGWHQHTTDGTFESVCVVPEGDEDIVYAAVARTDGSGTTWRTIERMQESDVAGVAEAACVDAHTSTYVSGVPNRGYYQGLRIYASSGLRAGATVVVQGRNAADDANQVVFDPQDVKDVLRIYDTDGATYRIKVTRYNNNGNVDGVLLQDAPTSILNLIPEDRWRFERRRLQCARALVGRTVTTVADGVAGAGVPTLDPRTSLGILEFPAAPGQDVHFGLPYVCDLQTLPVALQIDGLGQGRMKNLNRAWLRVYESAGLKVGPSADKLVAVSDLALADGELQTGEKRTLLDASWTEDGQLLVRQDQPFPATVVAVTAQVTFAG